MECINKYMKSTKEIKIHVNEISHQKVTQILHQLKHPYLLSV